MLRADHMHDQCLRQQPDYKPTGLEQRLPLHSVRVEHIPHHKKRHDIENGADWANTHHEARNAAGIPFPRLFEVIGIDIIPWD